MPEPAPTAVLAAPGWRARLAGADLPGRLLALLLLGAVGAAAGFLLVPPGPPRLPGPEALGTPAPVTIKADRDYDIVDEDATARRRAAAAAAERPVYDEDDSADDEAAARIHAAFALMREEEAALRAQRPVAEPAELLRRYASQRDAFVARLQLLVRDEDFAALAAARFGEGVERDLTALATKGLTGLVVGDRALLPEDRAEGFVVRTSRAGDATGSRVVTDLALVRDVATAREEVARAAAARLDGQPAPLRAALTHLATAAIRPTLVHNQAETERRRADAAAHVKPVGLQVKRGERIVSAGEVLEPRHLVVLDALRARRSNEDRSLARLGGGALVALLVAALWRFARRALPRFRPSGKDTLLLAVLLGGSMALAAGGVLGADLLAERWPALPRAALLWLVPLAAGAVVARQVLSAEAALLLALATGLGAGLVAGPALPVALQAIVT
ncbi:MAG TPA: phosphohydrolase, partial [Anaeromyxobacteraceae bacterium]|nr:phosphohydrolase [Anaeromyxobacteraceae bacterium]